MSENNLYPKSSRQTQALPGQIDSQQWKTLDKAHRLVSIASRPDAEVRWNQWLAAILPINIFGKTVRKVAGTFRISGEATAAAAYADIGVAFPRRAQTRPFNINSSWADDVGFFVQRDYPDGFERPFIELKFTADIANNSTLTYHIIKRAYDSSHSEVSITFGVASVFMDIDAFLIEGVGNG